MHVMYKSSYKKLLLHLTFHYSAIWILLPCFNNSNIRIYLKAMLKEGIYFGYPVLIKYHDKSCCLLRLTGVLGSSTFLTLKSSSISGMLPMSSLSYRRGKQTKLCCLSSSIHKYFPSNSLLAAWSSRGHSPSRWTSACAWTCISLLWPGHYTKFTTGSRSRIGGQQVLSLHFYIFGLPHTNFVPETL